MIEKGKSNGAVSGAAKPTDLTVSEALYAMITIEALQPGAGAVLSVVIHMPQEVEG
jgi:hypothetical protein